MPTLTFTTAQETETRALGAALGRLLPIGAVVLLHGDLGAGKTTLTQGIAAGLGVEETIQSPTFTLVSEHDGASTNGLARRLYHLDLYRLEGESEMESFGWETYLAPPDGVTIVEWPERAANWLPDTYLLVTIDAIGADQRRLTVEAVPANGELAEVITGLGALRR